jgi:hypothetical protein
MLGGRERKRGE